MANITQIYPFNQEFQLCTVSQLNKASGNEYKWDGRTLSCWIDDLGNQHEVDSIANFGNHRDAKLSARWSLNQHKVSADFKTDHGKVIVTTSCDEIPLPAAGVSDAVEFTKDGQTSSSIFYNSLLSIDVVPENDDYMTTRFEVNGTAQTLSDQYVYQNESTGNKTASNDFNIIVGFNLNGNVAGLSVRTIDGTLTRIPYNALSSNELSSELKMFNKTGNAQPPFDGYSGMAALSVVEVIDPHSKISSIGNYSFYKCVNLSSIEVSNALSIGSNSFLSCINLSSVSFPNVNYVGDYAFEYCHRLSTIEVPNAESVSDHAFCYCSSLTSICLPNVTVLNNAVFLDDSGLQFIDASNVTSINKSAFNNCHSLISVDFPQASGKLWEDAFYNCNKMIVANIPNVEQLDHQAFTNCSSLISISIPSLTVFEDSNHFYNCYSLTAVSFPNISSGVNSYCFYNCSNLVSVDMPNINSAGEYAFKNCFNLKSISLPKAVKVMKQSFSNCSNLISVHLPKTTTINISAFENCSNICSIDLPETKQIGAKAFVNNLSLTALHCPKLSSFDAGTNDNLANRTFTGAEHLLSIHIENEKMHSIGNGHGINDQIVVDANESCILYGVGGIVNLSNDEVKKIGLGAFAYCPNISSIECKNTLSIDTYAFYMANGPTSISMPQLTFINQKAFYGNSGIQYADFPALTSMYNNYNTPIFMSCSNLYAINLGQINAIRDRIFRDCIKLSSISCENVSYIGTATFKNCSSLISIDCEKLSSLGQSAFENCSSLISVSFPQLKQIESNINLDGYYNSSHFKNCINLKTANLSNAEYLDFKSTNDSMFYNCQKLENANVHKLSSIQRYMFYDCHSLSSIDALSAVEIGDYAFKNCFNLSTVEFPNASSIYSHAFENCSSLTAFGSQSTKLISSYAFNNCFNLSNVEFPNVLSIHSYAFKNCSSLTSVYIPSAIKIMSYALSNAGTYSSEIELPSMTYVNAYALRGSNFKSIKCPNVSSIGVASFRYCINLVSCDLPLVENFPKEAFMNCYSLTSINIPNVSSIGENNPSLNDCYGSFQACSNLISIDIPNCLSILTRAFLGCTNLSLINVPKLEYIDGYAFENCSSLTSIELPNVTSIYSYAFKSCKNLSSVVLSGNENVPKLRDTDVFYNISNKISVYIPEGMSASYMANSTWKNLKNKNTIDFIECTPPMLAAQLTLDDNSIVNIYGDEIDQEQIQPYQSSVVEVAVGSQESNS